MPLTADPSKNLTFQCPQCQTRLKAQESFIGKRVACPKCQAKVLVPGIRASSNDDDDWLALDAPSLAIPESVVPLPEDLWTDDHEELAANDRETGVRGESRRDPTADSIAAGSEDLELAPSTSRMDASTRRPQSEGVGASVNPNVDAAVGPAVSSTESSIGARRSVFDDDLPDLMPLEEPPSPQSPNGAFDGLPPPATPAAASPLVPSPVRGSVSKGSPPMGSPPKGSPPATSKPSAGAAGGAGGLKGSLEQLSREEAALKEYFQPPSDDTFSFPCKVCGTLLEAKVSRVGKNTRCPDCHSELPVPAPKPKKKAPEIRLDDNVADVRFAPVEAKGKVDEASEKAKTKQILDKARVEMERERKEIEPVSVSFDTKRWLGLVFGFLRDRGIAILTGILCMVTAIWFYAVDLVDHQEMGKIQIQLLKLLLFAVLGLPILTLIGMTSLAIIPMAANRASKVEEWPFSRWSEYAGEIMMLLVAVVIAAIPGLLMMGFFISISAPAFVGLTVIFLSIWGLLPLILLGMMSNGFVTQPFSKEVFQSIGAKQDAWGAMYFQTGFVFVLLLVLFGIARMTPSWSSAILGICFPVMCFMIVNQYGVLAGRISDVTGLGYEGDFSDD